MKFSILKPQFSNKSFTLVDVLIGTFLILVVFLGIFGAYRLAVKVVGRSKNKITATYIANGIIEKVRNLPYESVGIISGFPDGVLEDVSTITFNNIEYMVETRVDFVVDDADGVVPPDDDCPNDYKKVEVKVSWTGNFGGEVELSTDIAPKSLAQECAISGGILSVSVFDAFGIMVPSPLIEIKDPANDQTIKTATPLEGKHYFSLPASSYKVVVSKANYSTERTFGTDEIATPERPHLIVIEDEITEASFSIDKVSSFSIDTLSPWEIDYFSDTFLDVSKIVESLDVVVSGGEVNLAKTNGDYKSSGHLVSTTILPTSLVNWDKFSFSDSEIAGTQISYQVLYFDSVDWLLVPDVDLPGNSVGFGLSPINLSVLNIVSYPQLRLKGNLSTTDLNFSPTLYDWQVSWVSSEPSIIPNTTFNLQGTKIIGTDSGDNPVYKYSQDHTSDGSGHIDIQNLEWDSYNFSVDPATGLDLIDTDPSPQPIDLFPDTNQVVKLYLEAENSLLVKVQDINTGDSIFSATSRLQNTGLGYDNTQYTNEEGETRFIPLEIADYDLEVQAPGYSSVLTSVSVTGDVVKIIELERLE
jgi:hypothetical protein